MGEFLLGLDAGTTNVTCLVISADGRRVGHASVPLAASYPRDGWVEQDPVAIDAAAKSAARGAIASAGLSARDVAAIGIANQRETVCAWDRRSLKPLTSAIVWQDTRTAAECDALARGGFGERVTATTGLPLDPYFSATKIRWIRDHVPAVRAAMASGTAVAGTVDSWLVASLCGGTHATDHTNASRTLLYDLDAGTWSNEMLRVFDIDRGVLPAIVQTAGTIAATSALGPPIPITALCGDQQASAFGQGCVRPGLAKATFGTGTFLLAHAGGERPHAGCGLLNTVAWSVGGARAFAAEGASLATGTAMNWAILNMGLASSPRHTAVVAASVPSSGGVTFVPALTGLGTPNWNARARAMVAGLSATTSRAHILRALLEGFAHQVADMLEQLDEAQAPTSLRVDGGMSANRLLLQLLADVVGTPVIVPRTLETTAYGAALLAGLGAGLIPSIEAAAGLCRARSTVEPIMDSSERSEARARWKAAVAACLEYAAN